MAPETSVLWPWLALAGLGAFHGLNPAMGWLFAVGLGMHRSSRGVVLSSLAPIAAGHAAAVAAVLVAAWAFGTILDAAYLAKGAGVVLIGWALWHALAGHRFRLRVGMQTGVAALALWSCVMASAHGAGLMVLPATLSLCMSQGLADGVGATRSIPLSLAALAVHTAAMLLVIGIISIVVFEKVGLAFLRRGWINLDILWSVGLGVAGAVLIVS